MRVTNADSSGNIYVKATDDEHQTLIEDGLAWYNLFLGCDRGSVTGIVIVDREMGVWYDF